MTRDRSRGRSLAPFWSSSNYRELSLAIRQKECRRILAAVIKCGPRGGSLVWQVLSLRRALRRSSLAASSVHRSLNLSAAIRTGSRCVELCWFLLLPPVAHAQAVYGSIFGTITDQSGAAVLGAKLTMHFRSKRNQVRDDYQWNWELQCDSPDTRSI